MPQDSIFPTDSIYTGLRIDWEEVLMPTGVEWNLSVRRKARGEMWKTVHVSRWRGVMMDYVSTLAEDCHAAFFYGEPRDLARAAGSIHRLAAKHYRTCDFV